MKKLNKTTARLWLNGKEITFFTQRQTPRATRVTKRNVMKK